MHPLFQTPQVENRQKRTHPKSYRVPVLPSTIYPFPKIYRSKGTAATRGGPQPQNWESSAEPVATLFGHLSGCRLHNRGPSLPAGPSNTHEGSRCLLWGASFQPALVAEKFLRSSGLIARDSRILAKSWQQTQSGVGRGREHAQTWAARDSVQVYCGQSLLASTLKPQIKG